MCRAVFVTARREPSGIRRGTRQPSGGLGILRVIPEGLRPGVYNSPAVRPASTEESTMRLMDSLANSHGALS